MNFFPFHIGDYAVHTRHLSLMEDLAYRRLLDLYYTREGPLPPDEKVVARAIGMKECFDEVSSVLCEFFLQNEDGWAHARCDEEIAKYLEAEPERELRREHERERQRRSRARRRELFDVLRDAGEVPAFDTPMQTLQTMVDRVKSRAVTRDATGNQNQEPIPIPSKEIAASPLVETAKAARPSPDPFDGLNAESLNGKAVVALSPAWELPEEWGVDAQALGFKPAEVLHEGEKFRQFWTAGKGAGRRKTVKGWRQSWSNWLGKAAERAR